MALPFETLVNSLPIAVLVFHPSTESVCYLNAEFTKLTGWTLAEIKETKHATLIHLPDKVECAFCQGTGLHTTACHEGTFQGSQGEAIRVKVKHSRLATGEAICLLEPFAEDVLLTQAHSDFVSTVSHEFRTPLTSIKGFADTLLRYGNGLSEDQQRRFIAIIKDQADRLTRLVENLLSASKLGASRMEMTYRPVHLGKLTEKIIQTLQAKNNPERLFIVDIPDTLLPVWADTDKLEQVLLNLMDNAVKYSYPDTPIVIRAKEEETQPSLLTIQIEDQGVGISAEHLPNLFSQFSRIDNPLTRQAEGTGLGLFITKSLTLAMGGTITVDSQENKGSTFTLQFPAATAERQAAYRRKLHSDATEQE